MSGVWVAPVGDVASQGHRASWTPPRPPGQLDPEAVQPATECALPPVGEDVDDRKPLISVQAPSTPPTVQTAFITQAVQVFSRFKRGKQALHVGTPRDLFLRLDQNQSGFLTFEELKPLYNYVDKQTATWLNKIMKVKALYHRMLQREHSTHRVGNIEAPEGQISLEAFVKVYSDMMATQRRQVRANVKHQFDKLDTANQGKLGKAETAQLVSTVHADLLLLPPAFELEADWKMMTGTGAIDGSVSFDNFETWWRSRLGTDEANIPVIPEFISSTVNQVQKRPGFSRRSSQSGSRGARRNGRELWAFLRPRLKMLVQMSTEWGDLHRMYEVKEDQELFLPQLPWHIADPDSQFNSTWCATASCPLVVCCCC